MKLTKSQLKRIIKEELDEISRTPQVKRGEPSGSGSRQAAGTVKDAILDKFQELYQSWANAESEEGQRYFDELGVLIQEIEAVKEYDDYRYFGGQTKVR
jgi:hypothetical protein